MRIFSIIMVPFYGVKPKPVIKRGLMSYHNMLSNETRRTLEMGEFFDQTDLFKLLNVRLGDNLQENIEIIEETAMLFESYYRNKGIRLKHEYRPKRRFWSSVGWIKNRSCYLNHTKSSWSYVRLSPKVADKLKDKSLSIALKSSMAFKLNRYA